MTDLTRSAKRGGLYVLARLCDPTLPETIHFRSLLQSHHRGSTTIMLVQHAHGERSAASDFNFFPSFHCIGQKGQGHLLHPRLHHGGTWVQLSSPPP